MLIKKLILENFNRFSLNNIERIEYDPKSPYQILLGNNGSGKSSLLSELSPLPPDKNRFKKGGRKEIHLSHRGKDYILINDYSKKSAGEHQFIVDGINLNESGTVTDQYELCEAYFQYDNAVHDVVIGKTKFTKLTSIQRRDWFVRMSGSDMDFVMKLFNQVKSGLRDNQGALKITDKRLIEEQQAVIQPDLKTKLEEKRQEYRNNIEVLERFMPAVIKSSEALETDLKQITEKIYELNRGLRQADTQLTKTDKPSFEILELTVEQSAFQLTTLKKDYDQIEKEFLETESKLSLLAWNNALSSDEMFKAVETLKQIVDQTTPLPVDIDDLDIYIDRLRAIAGLFDDWCLIAPDNFEGKLSKDTYDRLTEQKHKVVTDTNMLRWKREGLLKDIDHILSHQEDVDCPQCHHRFKRGKNIEHLPKIKEEANILEEQIKQNELYLEALEKEIFANLEWLKHFAQFKKTFIEPFSEIRFFWGELIEREEGIKTHPKHHVGSILTLIQRLSDHRKHVQAKSQMLEYMDILNKREVFDGERLKGSLEILSGNLSETKRKIRETEVELLQDKQSLASHKQLIQLGQEMASLMKNYEWIYHECLKGIQADILREERHRLLMETAKIEEQLNIASNQILIVENILKHIEDLKRQKEAYERLIDVLNPNDGLIAKTLLGFIHRFVNDFNNMVSLFWSYPFKIAFDESSDFTQKYQFPIQVNNEPPRDDIRDTSEGQEEMINIVFRLLMMRYLGLTDFPLLLDETARELTEEHRLSLFNYFKQLVETGQIEQLFLISHIKSSHETFNLAEIISLDVNGVMVDHRVNKNIVFN